MQVLASAAATITPQSPWTAGFRPHLVTRARVQVVAAFVEFPIHTPAVRDSEPGHLEAFLLAMVYIGQFHATMIARPDLNADGEQHRAQGQGCDWGRRRSQYFGAQIQDTPQHSAATPNEGND